MFKTTKQNTLLKFLSILLTFVIMSNVVSACISQNQTANNFSISQWVNCTTPTSGTPVNNIVQTVQQNTPDAFFFYYVAIYLSIAILLLAQDRSIARFNYITLLGLMLAIVMRQYNLLSGSVIPVAVSLFIISLAASLIFR